ncbi:MAG: cytochrome c [Candidatus Binatia bacterium]
MQLRMIGVAMAVLCAPATAPRAQDIAAALAHTQFEKYCAPCHGEAGAGDGEMGATLRQEPKDFTDCDAMAMSSDDALFNAIKNGGDASDGEASEMPPMRKSLSDDEIHGLVARVRQFCAPKGGFSLAREHDTTRGK